jgi:hypothetical protein
MRLSPLSGRRAPERGERRVEGRKEEKRREKEWVRLRRRGSATRSESASES